MLLYVGYLEVISQRFYNEYVLLMYDKNFDDIFTGRAETWFELFQYYLNADSVEKLIGYDISEYHIALNPHNLFLELLLNTGLIGLTLNLALFFALMVENDLRIDFWSS